MAHAALPPRLGETQGEPSPCGGTCARPPAYDLMRSGTNKEREVRVRHNLKSSGVSLRRCVVDVALRLQPGISPLELGGLDEMVTAAASLCLVARLLFLLGGGGEPPLLGARYICGATLMGSLRHTLCGGKVKHGATVLLKDLAAQHFRE